VSLVTVRFYQGQDFVKFVTDVTDVPRLQQITDTIVVPENNGLDN